MLCCYRNACAPGLPTYACLHDAPMMLRPTQATRMNKIFSAYAEASVLKQGLQYPSYLCLLIIPTHLCLPTMPTHLCLPTMPTHLCLPTRPTHLCLPTIPTHLCLPTRPTHICLPTITTHLCLPTIPTHLCLLVMVKSGSELRSEPELDRTRPYFGVRVRVLTQTGPTVPVTGSANF